MSKEIDYKVLLEKYMAHVEFEESVTYVSRLNEKHSGNPIKFNQSEVDILKAMDKKIFES